MTRQSRGRSTITTPYLWACRKRKHPPRNLLKREPYREQASKPTAPGMRESPHSKGRGRPRGSRDRPYLPTAAEHAAWITKTPEKFLHASFKSEDVDEGHRCITAELREEPGQREVMAHFFDQTKFTAQEAQAWCSEQQLMVADFIPSKETNYPQVTAHGPREVTIYGDRARVIRASREVAADLDRPVVQRGRTEPRRLPGALGCRTGRHADRGHHFDPLRTRRRGARRPRPRRRSPPAS